MPVHCTQCPHSDIKPDNLMVQKRTGVLKIADFGTSNFSDAQGAISVTGAAHLTNNVSGTPQFFAPELAREWLGDEEILGTYDARALDLWSAGITIYVWCCGTWPFVNEGSHLSTYWRDKMIRDIAETEAFVPAPGVASPELATIIEGLLRSDMDTRLTLGQLRLNDWLTDCGANPLPPQPIWLIEPSEEDIEQAVTNRAAIAVGSASGPSALGTALAIAGKGDPMDGWTRVGNVVHKHSHAAAARFWNEIMTQSALAPYLPVLYSTTPMDESDEACDSKLESDAVDICMQDVNAPMVVPCAMTITMGCRTVLGSDFAPAALPEGAESALLISMMKIDDSAATEEELAAGGISLRRYLGFLDSISSTSSLGFRIDAAKAVDAVGRLSTLSLPKNKTFNTLREEDDLVATMTTFVAHDADLALAFLAKVQVLIAALTRESKGSFFERHVMLRSCIMLTYDDANHMEHVNLKLMNFEHCYALPEGQTITHVDPWDGTANSDEDGFLHGLVSFEKILEQVCANLSPEPAG